MSPRDIITRHIMSINGIRIPFARIIIDRIFAELAEYGYTITEGARADGNVSARSDNGRSGSGNSRR